MLLFRVVVVCKECWLVSLLISVDRCRQVRAVRSGSSAFSRFRYCCYSLHTGRTIHANTPLSKHQGTIFTQTRTSTQAASYNLGFCCWYSTKWDHLQFCLRFYTGTNANLEVDAEETKKIHSPKPNRTVCLGRKKKPKPVQNKNVKFSFFCLVLLSVGSLL